MWCLLIEDRLRIPLILTARFGEYSIGTDIELKQGCRFHTDFFIKDECDDYEMEIWIPVE